MGTIRTLALVLCVFSALLTCYAQQPWGTGATSAPSTGAAAEFTFPQTGAPPLAQANDQGASLLRQSLSVLAGRATPTDVTLTGTITVLRGAKGDDTGTITLIARGDTQAEVTMTMGTGSRTELRSLSSSGQPSESWTGPDGTVKHNPVQSLLTPHPAWFFPQFVLTSLGRSVSSSFVATETRNGASVNHLQIWQSPPDGSNDSALFVQGRTQNDLYLDPLTELPVAMVFYVQPDNPKHPPVYVPKDTRIPVEIRYSAYQSDQGFIVPTRIQAFVQGRQIYDIQISSTTFNSNPNIPIAN
jgi:hypothetical protein